MIKRPIAFRSLWLAVTLFSRDTIPQLVVTCLQPNMISDHGEFQFITFAAIQSLSDNHSQIQSRRERVEC